ncbi:hypothetical protein HDU91_004557, partial [Kappamyces sp. JEL0680]
FVQLQIPSGMNIVSRNSQVALDVSARLVFGNSDAVQASVGEVAAKYLNKLPIDNQISATGFLFGSDNRAENIIDAFSQISASYPVSDFVKADQPGSNASLIDYSTTYSDLDVWDNSTLALSFQLALQPQQPINLSVALPYIGTNIKYNTNDFIGISVNNFTVQDAKAQLTLLVKSAGYKEGINKAFRTWGNIINQIYKNNSDYGTVGEMEFGYSRESAVKTFSRILVAKSVNDINADVMAGNAQTAGDPESDFFQDMHTVLNPSGVDGIIRLSNKTYNWPFFHLLADISFESHLASNGSGSMF